MAAALPIPGGKMNVLTRLRKFLIAMVLLAPAAAQAADQSVWPLMPYQVSVFVAVAPETSLAPRLEASLLADLTARIEAVVGTPWNATVSVPPTALRHAMLYDMRALQIKDIPLKSPEPDKILLVAITKIPGGLAVTARDFDARTRTLNTAVTRNVWQIGSLCNATMDAMLTAFAPVARIERTEVENKDRIAILRVMAAGLPTRDPRLALLHPGDVFRPAIRTNNRDGSFNKVSRAEWSLCVVEKVTPEDARARVYSGRQSEIPSKGRGRQEFLALRVLPPGGSTVVLLETRVEPKKPLAGCDIYTYPPGKKDAVTLLGQTDRRGQLLVSSPKDSLMKVLLVKNGSTLAAKLPVVPGLEPKLTAFLPNDDLRLEAEGFNSCLEEELFDLVARQKILTMQIKTRIEAKDFEKAAEKLDEFRRLPSAQQFITRITREQEKLATTDTALQKTISTLLGNTRKLIDQHLDPHAIEELDREFRDAKIEDQSTVVVPAGVKPPAEKPVPEKPAPDKPAPEKK
jgi:hypothetical protein